MTYDKIAELEDKIAKLEADVAEAVGRRWIVQVDEYGDGVHVLDNIRRANPPIVLEFLDSAGNVTTREEMLPKGVGWLREHEADLLRRLAECARGWAADARLVGNITAGEVADVCRELLKRGAE